MRSRRADGDVVFRSRARATGTEVICEYVPSADEEQPWLLSCGEHGGCCSFETLSEARRFASAPDEWCEDCMYGPGALAGDGAGADVLEAEAPAPRW